MSAFVAILLALGGMSLSPASDSWFDLAQGRGTSLIQVELAAKRCGFRTNLGIMHGVAFNHHPDDQGGELALRKADATPANRRCLRQKVSFIRKRYRDLYFFPDAL